MTSRLLTVAWILAAVTAGGFSWAQEPDAPTKFFRVRPVVNPEAKLWFTVGVDKPDRNYVEGDKMVVSLAAEKGCFIYLLYFQGENAVCLFPNAYVTDNRVPAKTQITIPGEDAPFTLDAEPPHGRGVLVAIATEKQVDLLDNGGKPQDAADVVRELTDDDLKGFVERVQTLPKDQWAEFRIEIETSAAKLQRPPRRWAVCIGIASYPKPSGVQPLQVSHLDADRVAAALKARCGVDEVILLLNEKATRAAIEHAIYHELADKARPGDTIFIYYSGHGWRVADTDGDEKDGLDEAFVPYDAVFGRPATMILDDDFANWIRRFDACHVGIILDNCYAGGTSKALREPSKGIGENAPRTDLADFLEGEIQRIQVLKGYAKDLTQPGTMVIAACQPDQLAWEMPTKGKGSAFTYHVLELIGEAAADQQGSKPRT